MSSQTNNLVLRYSSIIHTGFPVGSVIKNPAANKEDTSLIPELGRSHGQRSLSGYCPWGRKEPDMT